MGSGLAVGDEVTVEVLRPAHGGHFVARHEGQVLFIRDVIPGERAVVRVAKLGPKGRFVNADLIEVVDPSPARVVAPCRFAGKCGGCDFQHVQVDEQRRIKMSVVRDQLQRLGHIDPDSLGLPSAAEGVDTSGLRWRTRMRLAVNKDGTAGLRRHGSHDVVAIDDCLIAHESLHVDELLTQRWPNADELTVAASPDSGERVVTTGSRQKVPLFFSAGGRQWQVSGGFWQSHYAAAETLASAVLDAAAAQPGSHVVDLYAGVGLFGGSLASAGPARIDVVEGHRSAADDAASNLADIPEARVHATAVEKYLRDHAAITPDVVVLDPPRRGARRQVVEPIAAWRPRAVVYVACDPAALARDIATFADGGYRLAALRVFDLFPMTHHIECVALLSPAEA